jgi:glycosyltransferase involved in cell wall biosynthesis
MSRGAGSAPRVLVLSANYPVPGFAIRGLWVERLVRAASGDCRQVVLVPTPRFGGWRPARDEGVAGGATPAAAPVHRVRTPWAPPGPLRALEAALLAAPVRREAERLRREEPFDLLHAHFVFPEGVVAAELGRRWGVPVVVSEHANWRPWLDEWPSIRRRVLAALPGVALLTAASRATLTTIREVAGEQLALARLPIPVDDAIFDLDPGATVDPDRLLFVGMVRRVKGLDVLLEALARLAPDHPRLRLEVIGATYERGHRRDELRARELVARLGLAARVRFRGAQAPEAVAESLRTSALLVLPSRRESFGSVVAEALACGTPVVATRCGGPEEIVGDAGRLVAVEDVAGLAAAIAGELALRPRRQPVSLRRSVVERFGMAATRARLRAIYGAVLDGGPLPSPEA